MLRRVRRLPSPALIIASIALVLAVGGGSFALAISDRKSDKKIAKKVANKQITKRLAGPLASGQTLIGYVNVTGHTDPGDIANEASISFQIPLAHAPTVHFIPVGGPSTGACPGTAAHPSAKGGNLCIYELTIVGATGMALPDGLNPVTATRFGVPGVLATGSATDYITRAAWAVKAP